MTFASLAAAIVALGIGLVPVWLLRRQERGRAQDYFVSSPPARPEVVRNASIAYALRMAALGPLFAWGASGDLWPAVIGAAFLGLGVYLIYLLREPLLEFLDDALRHDRSITIHEFIARRHGNDPRVRLLAASLTLCALLGLLVGEALAVAAVFAPLLPESTATAGLFAFGALLLTALQALPAGHSGVMHSAQLQLGMLYLGLFGATALVLYAHVSALAPLPPHGVLAVASIAVCGAIVLWYRRSRYVDTGPIGPAASGAALHEGWSGARLLSRFGKILNPCLSVLLVVIIVLALMRLYAADLPTVLRDSATALRKGSGVPVAGLIALCLLPLLQPLLDVTNWQRLAATRMDMISGVAPGRRSAELRGVFGMYATESALMGLFVCMLGALVGTETQGDAKVLQVFVAQLVAGDNAAGVVALPLLLICVFAAALSTMSGLVSASLCAIRYDVLAAFRPKLASGQGPGAREAAATRLTLLAGVGLGVAFAAAFCVAEASLRIGVTSSTFLALLFAICCAQLSLAPLVLGPIVGRVRGGTGAVTPGWALVVLGSGAAGGIAAVIAYLATGTEAWLWVAVPGCLGAGLVLFVIARTVTGEPA